MDQPVFNGIVLPSQRNVKPRNPETQKSRTPGKARMNKKQLTEAAEVVVDQMVELAPDLNKEEARTLLGLWLRGHRTRVATQALAGCGMAPTPQPVPQPRPPQIQPPIFPPTFGPCPNPNTTQPVAETPNPEIVAPATSRTSPQPVQVTGPVGDESRNYARRMKIQDERIPSFKTIDDEIGNPVSGE